MTPFYLDTEMLALAGDWHRHWKGVCDEFDESYYPAFKKNCDDYFYLPMREQWRGVGGLFFDDLKLPESSLTRLLYKVLDEFVPSYLPILSANRDKPYTSAQKRFQRLRRTIYLEFNLTTDRGVRFGLGKDASRTDAIMISAPPSCKFVPGAQTSRRSADRLIPEQTDLTVFAFSAATTGDWEYGWRPEEGSPEEEALIILSNPPRDWC